MTSSAILKVAVPAPLPQLFDYLPPETGAQPGPGCRVVVPFGRRAMVGLVVETAEKSDLPAGRLQTVSSVLDDGLPLLDRHVLSLLSWCWRYYKRPPGEVFASALPPVLRTRRGRLPPPPLLYRISEAGRQRLEQPPGSEKARFQMLQALAKGACAEEGLRACGSRWRKTLSWLLEQGLADSIPLEPEQGQALPGPRLNDGQAQAFEAIASVLDRYRCHLLDGVTGSGKTEVYICLIEQVLKRGRQVLVLVPEIGLTPQLLRRFSKRLGLEPATIHSGLTAAKRLGAWEAARSGRARLLVGTRSALFTPMPRLGLIVLDEEHDASFRQQDGFRYSARDVAVKRAAELGIPVVLGSATPSLESLHNAEQGRYAWHHLRERATQASLPSWRVLDIRQQHSTHGLTGPALEAMKQAIERGEQVMVFLNRRGYAPVLMCGSCGWHAACERCDANLTWHRGANRLCCHHCGYQRRAPALCPECSADALSGAGEGTQQLEEFLAGQFADVPVYRFDRDRVSGKAVLQNQLDAVREGNACLMVGTQMLAKGHHFPAVTLVVIVNIDQALYSADFRALERMGQLVEQVAGRAGRADRPGTVILQTLHPDHEALCLLLERGYSAYAGWLMRERRLAGLPPFGFQALLRADAPCREDASSFLGEALDRFPAGRTRIFGPLPAIMERVGGRYRMYLVMLSEDRPALHAQIEAWLPRIRGLSSARKVRWSMDIDPQEL